MGTQPRWLPRKLAAMRAAIFAEAMRQLAEQLQVMPPTWIATDSGWKVAS